MNDKLNKYKEALEANDFQVRCFDTKEEAAQAFLRDVALNETVGFGGSVTTRDMNLPEALKLRGNRIFSHWEVPADSSKQDQLFRAMTSDVYVCSANAITATGDIVNIDATGNRLASLVFGHKRVYLMVGVNKLVGSYEEAIMRIKNCACPPNAQRLNRNTPCASFGHCMNCKSPDRICKATLVLNKNPNSQQIIVYLINEPLGF